MTRAEFIAILMPLSQAMRTEMDAPTWTVYFRALEDVSPLLLAPVVERLIREPREFFPKAGELRGLCEQQRRALLAVNPYEGCVDCEEHGKGWAPVLVNGVTRMGRCGCHARHMAKLQRLGVSKAFAALPGEASGESEQVFPTVDQLPDGVRRQLLEAVKQKVLR